VGDPNAPELDAVVIFETLDRHEVEYILVGGFAALAYGATRVTYDVDVVPQNSDGNLGRLASALKELNAGARVEGFNEPVPRPIDAHVLRNELTTWRTDAGDLDVILWLPGDGQTMPFEHLAETARKFDLGSSGATVAVATLDHIIESKVAVGRDPDLVALPELRALRDKQRSTTPKPD